MWADAGYANLAVQMYTDLCMFDKAKEYMDREGGGSGSAAQTKQLIKKQADWAATSNDPVAAVSMYTAAGEHRKAIEILGERGWMEKLIEIARTLNKADTDALGLAARFLYQHGEYEHAAEIYTKMGDHRSLVAMYVRLEKWQAAFQLAEARPELQSDIYLPYAKWLASRDRFAEAQEAFDKAGRRDEAMRVLEQLVHNAVVEGRFGDAARSLHSLSMVCLKECTQEGVSVAKAGVLLRKFHQHRRAAEIYYAFNFIHGYTTEPFTAHLSESLFHMSRFLLHRLMHTHPLGVSKVSVLYALAKQAKFLKAYKIARHAFDKLSGLLVPPMWQETINLSAVYVRSKPFHDDEMLQPMCYRCSSLNPLINPRGFQCINCAQPWVQSYHSFENLPLVEFQLEKGLEDEEAMKLIAASPRDHRRAASAKKGQKQQSSKKSESMSFEGGDEEEDAEDPFTRQLMAFDRGGGGGFSPVTATREMLLTMDPREVHVKKWPSPLKFQFYKNIIKETEIALCPGCFHFFHSDDWEFLLLQQGGCPFCKTKPEQETAG